MRVAYVDETEAQGQVVRAWDVKLLEEAHQPHHKPGPAPRL